ncbi:MAG: hypothetical protein IT563_25400 [Alphaproteobacteria bacterium]|nr:hypothetical protein [Alphaproteobacteria bacterium]
MRRRRAGLGFERRPPRWRIALAALGVAAVLGLLMLEAASLGWIYLQRGVLYYGIAEKSVEDMPAALQVPDAVFHPYMGFIHRVGRKGEGWTTNNVGFQVASALPAGAPDCCDYPHPRRMGELLVGIFGGSVATDFALGAQVSDTLVRRLREIPAWRDREPRVLNFAMPAFRQPQQLATLAWLRALGQEFDVIVNIDGFNEIVTSQKNWQSGVEPIFPADTLWGAWGRELEQAAGRGAPTSADRALATYYTAMAARRRAEAGRCLLASCHVAKRLIARLAHWRGERLAASSRRNSDGQRATLFPTAIQSRFGENFDVLDYAAARWRDSSQAMAALARDAGAIYLHVIQPNQWWRESGDYRPIAADHIYGWVIEPVNKGYPALVERVPSLRAAGVEVLDATLLFKGQPDRAVYADDCCHYTAEGNERLMSAIADAIAAMHAEGRAVAGH